MALVSMNDGIVGVISKLEEQSPLAAATLLEYALYESLCDYTEAHRDEISKVLCQAARSEVAKAQGVAQRMGNGELLDALGEVEKKLIGYDLELFNRRVKRDKEGRFARQNSSGSTDDDKDKGSSAPKPSAKDNRRDSNSVRRAVRSGVIDDDTEVRVKYSSKLEGDGDLQPQTMTAADLQARMKEPSFADTVESVSVARGKSNAPKGNKDAAALFDLAALATDPGRANRLAGALTDASGNVDPDAFRRAGEDFIRPSSGNDRRAYRQMQALGTATRALSEPGTDVHLAGAMASIIGRLGPEAEAVIGPGVRRTAYRYRGTERRPDANLRAANARANTEAAKLAEVAGGDVSTMTRAAAGRYIRPASNRPGAEPRADDEIGGLIVNALHEHEPDIERSQGDVLPDSRHSTTGSIDSAMMQIRGDTAVANMVGALKGSRSLLPTRRQIEISMKSGSQPPSHGVIIDADGNLVTQAHGFNGDHYLPFDLKNLKALRGGQYVRTRAMGGPTTEDFYTGLMSGARQFQVVSNSGVFSVQFDPDLRGGRRYTDKSRKMVRRYEEILETIADSENKHGLMQQDFSPQQKAEIRERAHRMSRTPQEFQENLRAETARARFDLLSVDQQAEIQEAVEHEIAAMERQEGQRMSTARRANVTRDVESEMIRRMASEEPRQMQLDGEGYAAALDTLQAEFPYFLRDVKYEPLRDWAQRRQLRAHDGLPSIGASMRSDSGYRSRSSIEGELSRGYSRAKAREVEATAAKPAGAPTASTSSVTPTTSTDSASASTSPASTSQTSSTTATDRKVNQLAIVSASKIAQQLSRFDLEYSDSQKVWQDNEPGMRDYLRSKSFSDYVQLRVANSKEPAKELSSIIMEASPDELRSFEREIIDDLLQAAYDDADSTRGKGAGKALQSDMHARFKELMDLRSIKSPFSDRAQDALPTNDERPPKFDEIPDHTLPRAEFEAQALKFARSNAPKGFEAAQADIELDDNPAAAIAEIFADSYGQMKPEELRVMNMAWALKVADEANKKFNELPGGGTPKGLEEASKSLQRDLDRLTSRESVASEYLSEVAKRIGGLYGAT